MIVAGHGKAIPVTDQTWPRKSRFSKIKLALDLYAFQSTGIPTLYAYDRHCVSTKAISLSQDGPRSRQPYSTVSQLQVQYTLTSSDYLYHTRLHRLRGRPTIRPCPGALFTIGAPGGRSRRASNHLGTSGLSPPAACVTSAPGANHSSSDT